MTTVAVVKKAGQVAIAVDTLAGVSYVGVAGTVAHFPVLRKAMTALPKDQLKLGSKDEVLDTFTRLHPLLKDTFFLQTKEDDIDPYESSQFIVLIANASGIYGLYCWDHCPRDHVVGNIGTSDFIQHHSGSPRHDFYHRWASKTVAQANE